MADPAKSSFCCTNSASLCFWFAIFLVLAGVGLLLVEISPYLAPHRTALLFAAAGVACVVNFARNRTFHCAITGPFFLLVALYLALAPNWGWGVNTGAVWAAVLIALGAAMLLERRLAR